MNEKDTQAMEAAREEAIEKLVEYLFNDGFGAKAERLVLWNKDHPDLGGWGKPSVRDLLLEFWNSCQTALEHARAGQPESVMPDATLLRPSEVAPCPFCGSSQIGLTDKPNGSPYSWENAIAIGCSCGGAVVLGNATRETILKRWNRRSPPAQGGNIEVCEKEEKKDGATKFSFATNEESADITEKTSDNVRTLLPLKRTAFGSAEGRLDGINIHRSYRALLYHSVTKRVITCMFEPFQLDEVKSALGKLVIVRGELKKNVNGDTVRIVNPKLEVIEGKRRFSLPSLPKPLSNELRVPDFESERTTASYMRRIRGGSI